MDLIDVQPLNPGWGRIYQGSELSAIFDKVPTPRLVVSLIGETEPFIPNSLTIFMADNDNETLAIETLLAMCDSILAFLSRGRNILIHCFEGKYRSTYLDVAVHMRAGMIFEDAYALIRKRHTIASLRRGTMAQLGASEAILHRR